MVPFLLAKLLPILKWYYFNPPFLLIPYSQMVPFLLTNFSDFLKTLTWI